MALETLYGSNFMNGIKNTSPAERAKQAQAQGRVHSIVEQVAVSAGASQLSKYYLGQIPSNAVILPQSKIYWDDLDNSVNAPTLDLGIESPTFVGAADLYALSNGHDVKAGAGSAVLVAPNVITNFGKEIWEYSAESASGDPGELVDIIANLPDFAVDTGGNIAVEIYYALPS